MTFTATVSVDAPGAGTPTGSVDFYDGSPDTGVFLGSGTLDTNGVAAFSTSSLSVGDHSIYAVFWGNSSNNGSQAYLVQSIGSDSPS